MDFKLMKTHNELSSQILQIAQQMADSGAKYIFKLFYIRAFGLKDNQNKTLHFRVLGFELGSIDLFELELIT